MTKYEMGLKMAKLSEQNLKLTERVSVLEKTCQLAAGEIIRGNTEDARVILLTEVRNVLH